MDSASDIANCKRLLEELEIAERVGEPEVLNKLALIFEHLPPQVAPRLQKNYDHCATKSDKILGNLFDKVDISDKTLLNVLLKLLLAYGNFRTAQITYHIESYRDEIEPDLRFTPIITKTKWYDLTPLLPPAETIGWKALLIHSSLKDPDQVDLIQTCSKLLVQKLHFYAIISQIDRFHTQQEAIKKNGLRVAEKMAERVFDSANDDQEVVDLDAFQFNLILNFMEEVQSAALVEAIVIACLKSNLAPQLEAKQDICRRKLTGLIRECLVNRPNLQEIFVIKLIEQLKCNLVRRKRRHSVEAKDEEITFTLESIFGDIIAGANPVQLIGKSGDIKLSTKNLHKGYLEQWITLLHNVSTKQTLTPRSSAILVITLSVLLVSTSNIINQDLINEMSLMLAKVIGVTSQKKLDRFFKLCGPAYLSELTRQLAMSTELLEHFETPVMRFYRSYFARYMRHSTIRGYQKDAEKFSEIINFICEKTISKNKSHILEYIFLCELSDFLDGLGSKGGNKLTQLYVEYGKTISKKLYKFMKHRAFAEPDEDCDEMTTNCRANGDNGSEQSPVNNRVQTIVIDALVCIIKIAVNRKEQQMLDTYGELMLKLFNLMCSRIDELVQSTRLGRHNDHKAVDPHLHRLMDLYSKHKSVIEPYLCYDLNERICEIILVRKVDNINSTEDDSKEKKVALYEDLKSKLESIAAKDTLFYQTIINSQFATVVDQTISRKSLAEREEVCYKHYVDHMITISEVWRILFQNCDQKMYDAILDNVVKQFETCDALHHPQVLSLFYLLESLIPEQVEKNLEKSNSFKRAFPTIGCCLIRVAKSVELGPSIISFSNAGTHKSGDGIQCCTYSHCIRIYALIFDRFPATFTNSLITDAMQICISSNLMRYAKYSIKLHRFFIELASSIARLLKAVCMGKRDVVEQAMPVFLSVFSLLIRCIILASDQKKLDDRHEEIGHGFDSNGIDKTCKKQAIEQHFEVYESQLAHLAHDVGRLMNNLCFLETKLVDYATHLISTYIKDTQRASCPDFVKKHLDEGLFRIFNLVDSYQKERQDRVIEAGVQRKTTAGKASGSLFEMIHARLDQASREIFKDMHDEYNRFHRYLGKC